MDYLNAFWVGGVICALVQILLDKTKLLPGRVMVLLVCSGVVLSAAGIYQPLTEYAGAGASVPLLGFGNILWTGMKKAIDQDGLLGLFTRRFYCMCGRRIRRSYFFLPGQSYFPAQNERINQWKGPFCHERYIISPTGREY